MIFSRLYDYENITLLIYQDDVWNDKSIDNFDVWLDQHATYNN